MLYSIKGGKKSEKDLVVKALWFAKDFLLPRHKNIEIDIELKKNIKCDADVVSGDEHREYIMRVRKGQSEENLLTSVFHEMVHVKQDVRKEHPLLMNLKEIKKLKVVGINYKDTMIKAENFLSELGNPYEKIIFDQEGIIAIEWGAYGVPESFLIKDGIIIKRYIGPIDKNLTKEIISIIK